MAISKKRIIKSLDSLTDDLKDLLKEQYPGGYEGSITRITNAKNEPIFVFPLETHDATYLVKVPAIKNSGGGYDVEKREDEEFSDAEPVADADDDYDKDEDGDFGNDDDDYDGGGKRGGKEASYDPDFD